MKGGTTAQRITEELRSRGSVVCRQRANDVVRRDEPELVREVLRASLRSAPLVAEEQHFLSRDRVAQKMLSERNNDVLGARLLPPLHDLMAGNELLDLAPSIGGEHLERAHPVEDPELERHRALVRDERLHAEPLVEVVDRADRG